MHHRTTGIMPNAARKSISLFFFRFCSQVHIHSNFQAFSHLKMSEIKRLLPYLQAFRDFCKSYVQEIVRLFDFLYQIVQFVLLFKNNLSKSVKSAYRL